jgi:hypothetical protein
MKIECGGGLPYWREAGMYRLRDEGTCEDVVRKRWGETMSDRLTFARALIKGSLSCILPAVSISTTSNLFSLAGSLAHSL